MTFNSIAFLVFLPIVFILYFNIPLKYRWILLLISSIFFYAYWKWEYTFLLLLSVSVDYVCAYKIDRAGTKVKKKIFLWLSLSINLLILFTFKYFNFFITLIDSPSNALKGSHQNVLNLILPLGISFYTFQAMSYVIDVYRNKCKPINNWFKYLLFVLFFPQLVAGPIERFSNLSSQINSGNRFNAVDVTIGVQLIIWGFFKKLCIADRLAVFNDSIFSNYSNMHSITLLISGFTFTVQLYCDFSGYTDIAKGCAKLFSINLLPNWNAPLLATSVRDYWKRHHISLTNWFRDYIFIPLGGSRKGTKIYIINIFIIFTLSGIWHGANLTFLIWSTINAFFFIGEVIWQKYSLPVFKKQNFINNVYCLFIVSLSFIAFRSTSVFDAIAIYKKIFCNFTFSTIFLNDIFVKSDQLLSLLLCIVFITILFIFEKSQSKIVLETNRLRNKIFYSIILLIIILFSNYSSNSFIYFQF